MSSPLVSVIIPTYNRAAMLRSALDSVEQQTVKDVEVIVVDDGSTDDTLAIVESFGDWVRYIKQNNQGVSAARNRGIKAARGRYIAFLDSDDIWYSHKLERQLDYLFEHPDVGLVYGRLWSYHIDNPRERRLDPPTVARTFDELLNGPNTVTTSTVIVRRECFDMVGVFNADLPASEDHELWLRIARRFPMAFIDEALAEYRRHEHSINSDLSKLYEGYRGFYEILVRDYHKRLRNPKLVEQQLAKFEYLCGATAIKQGNSKKGVSLISQALARDLWVGTNFANQKMSWPNRVWLPIKPYAALTYGTLKSLRRN